MSNDLKNVTAPLRIQHVQLSRYRRQNANNKSHNTPFIEIIRHFGKNRTTHTPVEKGGVQVVQVVQVVALWAGGMIGLTPPGPRAAQASGV
jgi:hypothetical protein